MRPTYSASSDALRSCTPWRNRAPVVCSEVSVGCWQSRLSAAQWREQQVLRALAVNREPIRLADLMAKLSPRVSRAVVLDAAEGLRRRSLLERTDSAGAAAFMLQSVVLEYVTDRLVEDVSAEIERGRPNVIVEQALIEAQVKEYLRQSQERVIGRTIVGGLQADVAEWEADQRLQALLQGWRHRPPAEQGYGPGNVANLLRLLWGHLRGFDLRDLDLRQAYLAVPASGTSLAGAHLRDCVIAELMSVVLSTALSSHGRHVVAGTLEGAVRTWQVAVAS